MWFVEMRIYKVSVSWTVHDFALFISIYFIVVIIEIIRDNNLYDRPHSIVYKSKNFGGLLEVVGRTRHSTL
jgi:hypothetical protein